MIIGVIGLILIALSWFPQVVEIIKTKKSGLNVKFALIYVLGSVALVIYALQINDTIFILPNTSAACCGDKAISS